MSKRNLFLIGVVSLLLAVGLFVQRRHQSAPPPAPISTPAPVQLQPATAVPAPAFRWELGQRRTYSLFQQRTIHFRQNPTAAEKRDTDGPTQDSFRIAVRGSWIVTTVQSDAFGVLAEVELGAPTIELGTGAGAREQADRLTRALAAPFYLRLEPTGKLLSLRVPRGLGAFERGFLKALAATLQYVRGSGATWTSDELDATGEYRASYALSGDQRRCEKTRLRYTKVSAADGMIPVDNLGRVSGSLTMRYELLPGSDESARIEKAAGRESLDVDPGAGMPQVRSESEVALQLLATAPIGDVEARAARAAGADYEPVLLGEQERDPNSARRADQRTVNGMSFETLLSQLHGMPAGGDGARRAELLLQLAALTRLDAQTAKKAEAVIAQGASPAVASTLIGALGSSGSPAAQSALVRLAESGALSTEVRSNAVAILGLSEQPLDESSVALSKLVNDKNPDLRNTAALALGNLALSQRRSGQTGEAEHAVDELLEKLQAATTIDEQLLYLQAIGNTGDPRALPMLQTVLSSAEIDARAAAVSALRFMPGENVDALIASTLLRDGAPAVRKSAVFAASFRTPLVMLPSLRRAVLSDAEAAVRLEIVTVLGRSLALPGVAELLRELAAKDASPDVKRAAAALLAGPRTQ